MLQCQQNQAMRQVRLQSSRGLPQLAAQLHIELQPGGAQYVACNAEISRCRAGHATYSTQSWSSRCGAVLHLCPTCRGGWVPAADKEVTDDSSGYPAVHLLGWRVGRCLLGSRQGLLCLEDIPGRATQGWLVTQKKRDGAASVCCKYRSQQACFLRPSQQTRKQHGLPAQQRENRVSIQSKRSVFVSLPPPHTYLHALRLRRIGRQVDRHLWGRRFAGQACHRNEPVQ